MREVLARVVMVVVVVGMRMMVVMVVVMVGRMVGLGSLAASRARSRRVPPIENVAIVHGLAPFLVAFGRILQDLRASALRHIADFSETRRAEPRRGRDPVGRVTCDRCTASAYTHAKPRKHAAKFILDRGVTPGQARAGLRTLDSLRQWRTAPSFAVQIRTDVEQTMSQDAVLALSAPRLFQSCFFVAIGWRMGTKMPEAAIESRTLRWRRRRLLSLPLQDRVVVLVRRCMRRVGGTKGTVVLVTCRWCSP